MLVSLVVGVDSGVVEVPDGVVEVPDGVVKSVVVGEVVVISSVIRTRGRSRTR